MKVFKEPGTAAVIKFVLFSALQLIYCAFFLPPLREFFLKLFGAKIGKNSVLMSISFLNWHHTGPAGLAIGDECFIGDQTLIDLFDKVILENQVTLAQRVTVITHLNVGYKNHPLQKFFPTMSKAVIFKRGCVVGANATILPGVTVGERSFVAAGSVVNKNVPPRTLVGGVPAKVIKKL